jgi:hypothetical protein
MRIVVNIEKAFPAKTQASYTYKKHNKKNECVQRLRVG